MLDIRPDLPASHFRLELWPFIPADRASYDYKHARPEIYTFVYTPLPQEDELEKQFAAAMVARLEDDRDTLKLAAAIGWLISGYHYLNGCWRSQCRFRTNAC